MCCAVSHTQLLAYMTTQAEVFVVDTVTLDVVEMFSVLEISLVSDAYVLALPSGLETTPGMTETYQNTFRVCDGCLYVLGAVDLRRVRYGASVERRRLAVGVDPVRSWRCVLQRVPMDRASIGACGRLTVGGCPCGVLGPLRVVCEDVPRGCGRRGEESQGPGHHRRPRACVPSLPASVLSMLLRVLTAAAPSCVALVCCPQRTTRGSSSTCESTQCPRSCVTAWNACSCRT